MALQLQAVAIPQRDGLTDWSVRVLVTRNGSPLNGLSARNFAFTFPWKDEIDGGTNQFEIDPLSPFNALGSPGGPHSLDGLYQMGLVPIGGWSFAGFYFCTVTVKYGTQVTVGEAVAPFPHPIIEIDTEQAQAMVSFFLR